MWSRERDERGIETERRVEKFQFFPRSRSLESRSQFLFYTEMPLFFTVSGATKETIVEEEGKERKTMRRRANGHGIARFPGCSSYKRFVPALNPSG